MTRPGFRQPRVPRLSARLSAGVSGALAASVLLAACGGTTGTPAASERTIAPNATPTRQPGGASVSITGAKQITISQLSACTANTSNLSAVYQARDGSVVYLFQIVMDQPKSGEVAIGQGKSTVVSFSDSVGDSWDSTAPGAQGHLTVDDGLRSGSVDATLVDPVDKTTVGAKGTWRCGG